MRKASITVMTTLRMKHKTKQQEGVREDSFKCKYDKVPRAIPTIVITQIHDPDSTDSSNKTKLLRYEFAQDQIFLGEVLENKAHGHGIFHYRGCQYGGRWDHGMESIGCYLWKSGVQYYGLWENGLRHGNGVEKHRSYVYKGEWSKGAKQGYGVMSSHTSACKYEGTWHNGAQEGYGVEVYKDGSFYAGQFNNGIRDGHGVRVVCPNNRLKQTFTKDDTTAEMTSEVPSEIDLEKHVGSQVFDPGETHEGEQMTEIYRGHWKGDKRHGPGVEKNSRGDVYEGTFKDNLKHGYGVLRSKNGQIFGKWKKNKLLTNKRTMNSSSNKAAEAAKEACQIAERKTWLALSRAQGARRFALWASHSQREAYKHYALGVERERETTVLVESGSIGANVIAQAETHKESVSSPGGIARSAISKISDIASLARSPKMGGSLNRKSFSTITPGSSDCDDSPISHHRFSQRLKPRKLVEEGNGLD